jgi:UDP-GlcNAc:undecaprenyl-phosphate/decaprenyl-phosphate GlcNAc-1-phosphate transferase
METLSLFGQFMGWPLGLSFTVAVLAGFLVRKLYTAKGWVDDPVKNNHSKVVHKYPVPRGGGLVILAGLAAGIFSFIGIDKHMAGILAGLLVLAILGTVDDIKDIHPYWRLLGGLIAALCVVAVGIGIAYITNPLGEGVIRLDQPQLAFWLLDKWRTIWILSDIFALIWIVWCMNMLNWSKGVDGQLPGIVVIAAVVIGILSLRFVDDVTQWPVIQLAAVTAGAYLGLLVWNVYPQRMMPGYGAGSMAGFLLAVLSILSGAKLATLLLVLAVPMIDAIYVMAVRIAHKKSPIWGDRSHLHHALMDLSWGKRRIAAFYWLVTLVFGILALQLNPEHKAFTIVLMGLMVGGLGAWLRQLIIYSKRPGQDSGSKT